MPHDFDIIRAFLGSEHELDDRLSQMKNEDEDLREKERVRYEAKTLEEISEATELDHERIRVAMKEAEDDFVHWRNQNQPTRYGLAEHAGTHYLELMGWQPGVDFLG